MFITENERIYMKNDAGEDCAVLVRNITPDGDWYSAPGGEMRSGEALTERLVELIREQCGVIVTPKEILFDEKTGDNGFREEDALYNGLVADWWKEEAAVANVMKMSVLGFQARELETVVGPVIMIVVDF